MPCRALRLGSIALTIALGGCHPAKPRSDEEFKKQGTWQGWRASIDCFQARLSPCRTVRSHSYFIQKGKWGILDASIFSEEEIEALNDDYSTSMTVVRTWRKHWIFPVRRQNATLLHLRSTDQIVTIDHIHRVIYVKTGARGQGFDGWNYGNAPDCSHANPHYLYLQGRVRDSVVAGIHVVGYYWHNEEESGRMYFAPSMGCGMFRRQVVRRKWLWMPTSFNFDETDSFILGPPDAQLFAIPKDYKSETWHPGSTLDGPGL